MKSKRQNFIRLCFIITMCLSCIFRISIVSIVVAILYLIVEKRVYKKSSEDMGAKLNCLLDDFKKYWWLILIPAVSGIIAVSLSKIILPEFYQHVLDRANPMLSFDSLSSLLFQLLVLALGEELAFRAFLQKNISIFLKPFFAIIITSFFFAISHYSSGSMPVILYDLLFVFLDSVVYGVIFNKTKNVYSSTLSHFIANTVGLFILLAM